MEEEFFNERNCFQHNAKPENLACMSSLVTCHSVYLIKNIWLAF